MTWTTIGEEGGPADGSTLPREDSLKLRKIAGETRGDARARGAKISTGTKYLGTAQAGSLNHDRLGLGPLGRPPPPPVPVATICESTFQVE